jgi:hypothetical protein
VPLEGPQVDDKAVQEIVAMFNSFFTVEQVTQTLLANLNDKAKTVNDLKYKESKKFTCDS